MKMDGQVVLAKPALKAVNYEQSATFSACLTMENDARICAAIDKERRIDGTVTAEVIKTLFASFEVELDEWAQGAVDFAQIAQNFNLDREPVAQSETVIDCLKAARIDGFTVELSKQLDKSDYAKVDKILNALGGKWDRRSRRHVFTDKDPGDEIANYIQTGRLEPVEKFDFFPTPVEMARQAASAAMLEPGMLVLDPEVGTDRLATACAEYVGVANVICYEIQAKYCDLMIAQGFKVERADFMEIAPEPIFDACVLNPPFRKQQDIDHVMHAYRFLKPGGRISAIMSLGVTFRSNLKSVRFREFLDAHQAVIKHNRAGAFKESGTMVQTISVVFQKPLTAQHTAAEIDTAPQTTLQSTAPAVTPVPAPKSAPAQIGFDF